MDTLHTVMRSIRGETKRRDHLSVFREFLDHLDRVTRARTARMRGPSGANSNGRGRTAATRRNGKA
jgi:hypothetical protein